MAEIAKPTIGHVAGYVRGPRYNKDGSLTFKVVGTRFTLNKKDGFVKVLLDASRVLIRFEALNKNPKILLVVPNPTSKIIREYNQE